ncbi:MAG: GNAT family N-acetyltransferase [Pseudomonadota bacterium]|nr:GNAT family N-acetyltransferase [Pseudomonadota bacterium]
MVPLVETARLILRGHRHSDLEPQAAMLRDPAVARYLGGHAFGREDSWRRLLAARGAWELLGYGYWAVERQADGAYIGLCGFADFKRDMTPSIEGLPEMGWIFAAHGQGQGYATEAVAAGLRWADAALSGQEITAIIDPANNASIRLAEKSGFSLREDARYNDETILLMRRPPGT